MKVQLLSVAGDLPLGDKRYAPDCAPPDPPSRVVPPSGQKPASLSRLAERAERGTLGSIQLLFLG
jgi:hypothetical protein